MTFPALADSLRLERLALPGKGARVVVDTDTNNEIDDQFALVHALLSPEIRIEAVYAAPFANARAATPEHGMEQSFEEIMRVYKHMKLPQLPPVHKGSRAYLNALDSPEASPVTDHLIETAFASDEPLYVLGIGAITNVANALLLEPKLVERIVLVWLGGHAHHYPHTWEFNLQQDMLASKLVFDCGVPLVQLPCRGVVDVLHTTVPEMERYVKGRGAVGDYLYKIYTEHVKDHFAWSKELWDTATLAYVLNSDWLESDLRHSPILNENKTYSFDKTRHLTRYVYRLERDPIMRDFFAKLDGYATNS